MPQASTEIKNNIPVHVRTQLQPMSRSRIHQYCSKLRQICLLLVVWSTFPSYRFFLSFTLITHRRRARELILPHAITSSFRLLWNIPMPNVYQNAFCAERIKTQPLFCLDAVNEIDHFQQIRICFVVNCPREVNIAT